MDVVECLVSIRFRELAQLYALGQIAFDGLHGAREGISFHVVKDYPKACPCGTLGDAVAHRARADYTYRFNRLRIARCFQTFARLPNLPSCAVQRPQAPGSTPLEAVVILYAQPKRLYCSAFSAFI